MDLPLHGTEAFVPAAYRMQDLPAPATEPSPLAQLSLNDYAHRVEQHVREAARYGPVVLAGHSMGGTAVSRSPTRYPTPSPTCATSRPLCPSDPDGR